MIEQRKIDENIYCLSSSLLNEYFKLKNSENVHLFENKFLTIYEKICSLETKNNKEVEFKNNFISLIKGNIESDFPNIFEIIDKKSNNESNKNNLNDNNSNEKQIKDINQKEGYSKMINNYNEVKKIINNKEFIKENNASIFKEIKENTNKIHIKEKDNIIHKNIILSQNFNEKSTAIINGENNDIENNINFNNYENYKQKNDLQKNNNYKKIKILQTINELINNKTNINIIQIIKELSKDENNEEISKKLRQLINETYKKLYMIISNINNNIEIGEEYTNKLLTLICAIFPFLMKNQKNQILKINIKKEFFDSLNRNLLLNNSIDIDENHFDIFNDIILSHSDIKLEKEIIKQITKTIFNDKLQQVLNIYYSYKLILFYKIINGDNHHNTQIKLLSFEIKFFLSNFKIFNITLYEFINIYKDLLLMKNFYSTIYYNEIKEPYTIEFFNSNIFYGEEKLKKNYLATADIDILFNEKENEIYYQILDINNGIIPHFYKIEGEKISDLIEYSSFFSKKFKNRFFSDLFDLINIKNYIITEHFERYRNNLIKLEKEIYIKGNKYLTNNKSNQIISKYIIKEKYEEIFNRVSYMINKIIDEKYKNKYRLLPFGSVTEFLSTNNSDIDIYLCLEELNKEEKNEFLIHILHNLESCKKYFQKVEKQLSLRICLIKFVFEGTSIDLSITAFCPYIHSLLFREYSLIDARFALISVALKDFVKITDLGKDAVINSFSWNTLLVLFLQDIIQPPVLPKLLSNKEINEIYYKTIEFGNNTRKIRITTFSDYLNNTMKEKIPIPDCLFKKDKILKIYENFKKNNYKEYGCEKNVMTCSELILKFLEFIMLLKFDSIYADCSIEKEGYFNMSDIKFLESNKNEFERQTYNNSYYNYFKKKYLNFRDRYSKEKKRDGLVLIRDPFDPHYNPAQTFREENNLDQFMKRIKYSYSNLLKYGSFEKLNEKFKMKEMMKWQNKK